MRTHRNHRWRHYASVMLLAGLLCTPVAHALGLEQRVQAAFLYNVAKFVTWPPQENGAPDPTMNFCILGDPEFAAVVRQELANKRVGTAAVTIQEPDGAAVAQRCHILFFSKEASRSIEVAEADALGTLPVLTVGAADSFLNDGGIMRLKRVAGKLRFEISLQNLQASGLEVSSKLLRLADIIPASAN